MNSFQKTVNDLYTAKLKKYGLNPDVLSDRLRDHLLGEALKEAQEENQNEE